MCRNYICLALLLGGLVTTPAFAQKSNPKKIIQAITAQSAQNSVKNSVGKGMKPKISRPNNRRFPNKNIYLDPTVQRLLVLQVKNAANKHNKQIIQFRLFDQKAGIIPALADFWSELDKSIQIVRNGPVSFAQKEPSLAKQQVPVSPEALRHNLLQKEQNLQQAFKRWKALPRPKNLHAFFINGKYSSSYSIGAYLLEEKDFVQLMAPHKKIKAVQDEVLNWARGKGKYPFTIEAVSGILQLEKYTDNNYDALYKNLNSPGCRTLRAWGWQDEDIRQVIRLYQNVSKLATSSQAPGKINLDRVFNTAINWLYLQTYSPSELTDLYARLDSPGCSHLRFFGWTDSGIRQVIKLYQDFIALDCPSDSEHLLKSLFDEAEYVNSVWIRFFNRNIQENEKSALNIRQQLENNR